MGLCTKCETLEAAARRGLSKQQVSSAQKLRATRLAVPTESAPSPAWDSLDVQAGSGQDSGEVPWSFLYSKLIFLLCPFPFLNEPQRRRAGLQRGREGWGGGLWGPEVRLRVHPPFPAASSAERCRLHIFITTLRCYGTSSLNNGFCRYYQILCRGWQTPSCRMPTQRAGVAGEVRQLFSLGSVRHFKNHCHVNISMKRDGPHLHSSLSFVNIQPQDKFLCQDTATIK